MVFGGEWRTHSRYGMIIGGIVHAESGIKCITVIHLHPSRFCNGSLGRHYEVLDWTRVSITKNICHFEISKKKKLSFRSLISKPFVFQKNSIDDEKSLFVCFLFFGTASHTLLFFKKILLLGFECHSLCISIAHYLKLPSSRYPVLYSHIFTIFSHITVARVFPKCPSLEGK